MAVRDGADQHHRHQNHEKTCSHVRASELELFSCSRAAAEQRPADRRRKDVVEIKVQLTEKADAGAAGPIDRNHRLRTYLKITADPDHTWIDGSGGDRAVAEIIGDGC